ncbi:unnamed protein product [Candidula unifasciata]|uniref:CAF17 C-terminal domain-containing protein n=1 Tax=Candidula unifasciata TaxID=100452 RepID=A0A8S3ZLJ5_9EUPU|nr:unnamed protein product [Candidula unifasciata]
MYRKHLTQSVLDTRSVCDRWLLINKTKLFSKYILRKSLHMTKRWETQSLCHLKSRGVVQLSGKDTPEFLQGLVTNNVKLLAENSPSVQYCMMLNVQGRVLYDLFVYNVMSAGMDPVTFHLDVDVSAVGDLIQIFKKYKLRKKVDISDVSDTYRIWSQFDTSEETTAKDSSSQNTTDTFRFEDPRVPTFADRIITAQDSLESGGDKLTEEDYRKHRYQWGIPEGISDLPSGKCLPLESNLDFMNGVNFQKGCYIGQELTARTFHTGVIRKRIVPVSLGKLEPVEPDTTVTIHEKSKNAGKLRNSQGKFGICLLRLEHIEEDLEIVSKNGVVVPLKAHIPKWWPSISS